MFKVNDHKLFSPFLLPFVFVMAMLPQNVVQMYEMIGRIGFFGVGLLIGYPALLLVIAVARKKRGDAVDRIAADSGSTG